MQISNPCVGKQCLRCMASCRIRHFCHCLHIQMHSHTHLFRFIHSHTRYLACSQKFFPFANRNQFANGTKCSRTGHSCSRTGSVRGWDGTYICNLFQYSNKDIASHPFMNQMQAPHHGSHPFLYLYSRLRPFTVFPIPSAGNSPGSPHSSVPIWSSSPAAFVHTAATAPYPSPPPALQYQPPVLETVNRPSKTSR